MKHLLHVIVAFLVLLAGGCVNGGMPRGARVVGGGLLIEWEAARDGTVILIEKTSGKPIVTKSLQANGGESAKFKFDATKAAESGTLHAMFDQLPANAIFVLYFVPSK